MIFRQLFDATSSTYTYLLADEHGREAVLIDPVFEQAQRDLALIEELELKLKLVADTHCHADHITAAWLLKQKTGCRIASAATIGAEHVDVALTPDQRFGVSGIELQALATPGHTDGCMSFMLADHSMVFTGDTLLIRGCGRIDFQQGDASALYRSITEQLFTLPPACAVYPAHDYQGRMKSTIGEEQRFNARIGGDANRTDFVGYMEAMHLPHPKRIDEAVPANLRSGAPEDGRLPEAADWADLRITFAGVPEVESAWLIHNQPSVTVLDVRTDDEIIEGECPPGLDGAVRIPLDELSARIDEVPGDKPVVALCRSGRRSALAVNILKKQGFKKVASLRGGLVEF